MYLGSFVELASNEVLYFLLRSIHIRRPDFSAAPEADPDYESQKENKTGRRGTKSP